MVNELGSVPSLHVATPWGGVSRTGGPSVRQAGETQTHQVQAGHADRPAFLSLYAQIRDARDLRGEAAIQLRQAHTGLEQAGDLLAEIKARLLQIVKQYPPFAQDNPQRIAYLNAITGLRKQLDALTFPPERQAAERARPPIGADWQNTDPPPPRSPVPEDLAIPELDPLTARDADVSTALDAVSKAQDRIAQIKGNMWQDVVDYVGTTHLGEVADFKAYSQARLMVGYLATNPDRGIGLSAHPILAAGA